MIISDVKQRLESILAHWSEMMAIRMSRIYLG